MNLMCVRWLSGLVLSAAVWAPERGEAATVVRSATMDRWMYPFNTSNGTRGRAPTFGAPGSDFFDDFEAQLVMGFAGDYVQSGVDAGRVRVNSVRVEVANGAAGGTFMLDSSYDANEDLRSGAAADGLPVELYGVDYRNGASLESWGEASAYSSSGGGKGSRDAYAFDVSTDGARRPVENSLFGHEAQGVEPFERNPWSVGTVDGVAQGGAVRDGDVFLFELDLSLAGVREYVAQSLVAGELRFALISLHAGSQPGTGEGPAPVTPQWITREDVLGPGPRLVIDYEVLPVPEPSVACLALLGAALGLRRRR